jgi:putative tryptophan/tyrosine transport system substrate-binding protein
MRRREFIVGIVGGATAWPFTARAQQSTRVYRIAFVHPSTPTSALSETGGIPHYRVFFEELRRLGYVEGRNLAVTPYSGGGRTERYAELAREVVRTKPDAVLTNTSRMVLHFKAASTTIPIVGVTSDPVALGIAISLARPGSNFTGTSADTGPEVYAKQLELLKEAVPAASTVGFIARPDFLANSLGMAIQGAAQRLGIRLILGALESFEEADYRNAFGAMAEARVDAVLFSEQAEHYTHRRLIVELAETNRLPTMTPVLDTVAVGGLIAYGNDLKDLYRYLASCVDKVLRGENPGEIPIYQNTRFNLAINLKTAQALGLVIPASLIARADEVIE